MASSTPLPDPTQAAFNKAIREFKANLKNEAIYSEILSTTSADQVYDLTDKLQNEQGRGGHLRNLAKLKPYLERLQGYSGAIDTFVQAKAEALALIWGPIKLLLQWASTLTSSLDALINTTAEIGLLLPEFGLAVKLFGHNSMVKEVLALFFQDILDFYLVTLKFFSMPRFKSFFEAVWPKKKQQIDSVINRIVRHTTMLRNEVRLEHIQEEYNARARDMEHFENLERSTRRTEYGVLETRVAPVFYDTKLNYLRGRLCGGTGSWFLDDSQVKKWLNVTKDSPKVIWLRGIPGAGKTFLAACIIDETRSRTSLGSRVIFSFLHHSHRDKTSALSVLHSLLFQLARDDGALQDVLCEISRETLSSDPTAATDILIKLLTCSGRVHIIIDGLDEIDEIERARLLQEMLRVSKSCEETRILVSCRAEHDLEALLKPGSTVIRVDMRNTDSIQTYVSNRYCDWVQNRHFSPEDGKEIMTLLSPIASRAKGMFMYAQLILKSLEFLDTIDEVRDELKILPTDLDDAYGRIFSRVNERLPPGSVRDKARRILGWVGCSPVPMTIEELEQALSIRIGDYSQIPKGYSALNLVRLCGPVVEVVDGEVQFVHFTAKEYFFSHDVAHSLDIGQYTLSLAKCCITYLCQAHHDPDINEDQLETHLINGVYRLHHYATGFWLRLIELYSQSNKIDKGSPEYSQLLDLLRCVLENRVNGDYIPIGDRAEFPSPKSFKDLSQEVYDLLCSEAQFHQKSESRLFQLGEDNWETADPLTLRRISASVQNALDKMANTPAEHAQHRKHAGDAEDAEQCHCDAIRHNYGARPFKCPFVSCLFHRIGFETKKLRQSHCKSHDRPWRCDVPTCEYTEIGFLSRRMRDDHLDRYHRAEDPEQLTTRGQRSNDELVSLLLALIRTDKVHNVRSLLPAAQDLEDDQIIALFAETASLGSSDMIEIIGSHFWDRIDMLDWIRNPFWEQVLVPAVTGGNLETLGWLTTKAGSLIERTGVFLSDVKDVFVAVLMSDKSVALYNHLELSMIAVYSKKQPKDSRFAQNSLKAMDPTLISATRGRPQSERILISLWKKLDDMGCVPRRHFGTGLLSVAKTTCSITLASALIDLGGDLEYQKSHGQPRPLQRAAQKDTEEAARFLRFLLYRGANPKIEYEKRLSTSAGDVYRPFKVSDEVGAKGISKWLKKSWEDLVAEAREARVKHDNPPIPED